MAHFTLLEMNPFQLRKASLAYAQLFIPNTEHRMKMKVNILIEILILFYCYITVTVSHCGNIYIHLQTSFQKSFLASYSIIITASGSCSGEK